MSKLGGLHIDFKVFTDIVFWFSLSWSYHIGIEQINQRGNNSLIRLKNREIKCQNWVVYMQISKSLMTSFFSGFRCLGALTPLATGNKQKTQKIKQVKR